MREPLTPEQQWRRANETRAEAGAHLTRPTWKRWAPLALVLAVCLAVGVWAVRADAWPVAGFRWGDPPGAMGTAVVATPGPPVVVSWPNETKPGPALGARARWIFGQSCLDSFTLPPLPGYRLVAADVTRSCVQNPYGLSVVAVRYEAKNNTGAFVRYSIVLRSNGVTYHDFDSGPGQTYGCGYYSCPSA